jgi:hypothetical protein
MSKNGLRPECPVFAREVAVGGRWQCAEQTYGPQETAFLGSAIGEIKTYVADPEGGVIETCSRQIEYGSVEFHRYGRPEEHD